MFMNVTRPCSAVLLTTLGFIAEYKIRSLCMTAQVRVRWSNCDNALNAAQRVSVSGWLHWNVGDWSRSSSQSSRRNPWLHDTRCGAAGEACRVRERRDGGVHDGQVRQILLHGGQRTTTSWTYGHWGSHWVTNQHNCTNAAWCLLHCVQFTRQGHTYCLPPNTNVSCMTVAVSVIVSEIWIYRFSFKCHKTRWFKFTLMQCLHYTYQAAKYEVYI